MSWREGVKKTLRSRFVAVRVRPAHRDYWRSEPHAEQWLLASVAAPEQRSRHEYWLSNLPAETPLKKLVELAKQRWIIERDYLELKQELEPGHFEGRSWRGFHHHATLCIAAYGFLVAERSRISASAGAGRLDLTLPPQPEGYQPRGGVGAQVTIEMKGRKRG
ncbi:MAG: transposase [Bryobacteraceae bacterium]